jgi:hypothetical protein
LFLFSALVQAQEFLIYTGPIAGNFHNAGFNSFARSFDKENSALLDKQMRGFNFSGGFSAVVACGSDEVKMTAAYLRYFSSARAVFKSGEQLRCNQETSTPINFGVIVYLSDDLFQVGANLGMAMSHINIGLKYKDGTLSYGPDYFLSGVYNTIGSYYSVNCGIKLKEKKNFSLRLNASFNWTVGLKQTREYEDYSWGKSVNLYTCFIPIDYGKYIHGQLGVHEYVRTNSFYPFLSLNLAYCIDLFDYR